MPNILIAGGTGLVGTYLTQKLLAKGYQLSLLSRSRRSIEGVQNFQWDVENEVIDAAAFEGVDHIINLAGAGIADGRWSEKYKKILIDSRVKSAAIFRDQIMAQKLKIKSYVAASAIGYYGNRGDEWLTEEMAPKGSGFMIECCEKWEEGTNEIKNLVERLVTLRIGIVLSKKGGALSKMLPSYHVNVGSYFGDGQQYYAWIHIDDLAEMIIESIENQQLEGVYNAVSPKPVTNKVFAKAIGQAMDKSTLILPVPAFTLRATMGEMADVVLNGNRVSADKIIAAGFEFQFPDLVPALKDVIERKV